jgi:hypothetical protein
MLYNLMRMTLANRTLLLPSQSDLTQMLMLCISTSPLQCIVTNSSKKADFDKATAFCLKVKLVSWH